jgi:hypothetical protein
LADAKDSGQSGLHRIDLDTKETELIASGVKAYDLSNDEIFLLQENNVLSKINLDGGNSVQVTLSPIVFSKNQGNVRLIAYDDNRQAIVSEEGEFFMHNKGENEEILKKIGDDVKGVQFSNDGKKILFWKDNEISILFLRKWDVQPRRDENELQQISRFSFPIKNVFWYRDYEHVFFCTQGLVKIIELDPRDQRTTDDLFRYSADNFLSSYDSSNGIYYYLDEVGGIKKLFHTYIPEQTNFFGE